MFWARAMWDAQSVIINSNEAFSNHFKEVFGVAAGSLSVQDQLLHLRQRDSSLDDYTLEFATLAGTSGWNEIALLSSYRLGLNPCIRALMAIYDDTMGLESFMQRASRISQCLAACDEEEVTPQRASPASGPPVPGPMKLDSARLCLAAGLCLYCASLEHLVRTCPVRPPCPAVSTLQFDAEVSTLSLLPGQLLTPESSVSVSALVNSGSSGNFISQALLTRLNLPRKWQPRELRVETIQGKPVGRGRVNYRAPPLKLRDGCLHEEII